MKTSKLIKTLITAGITLVCAFSIAACSNPEEQQATEKKPIEGLTGGIAATVNGVEIEEDTITTYLQSYRSDASMSEEDTWGQWLVDNDYTPETVREEIIDYYVGLELIRQAAAENNIEIDATEIDEYVNKMRAYYSSDEEWEEALAGAGINEEEYRNQIELALMEERLQEEVVQADEPTDEELLEYAKMYASAYDGAKKSSHILFDASDQATAQEVLNKIKAGELSFEDAVAEYSTDSTTTGENGNTGWDVMSSLPSEYTAALVDLETDEISGLVTSDYGIHIIKVTETFVAPEEVTDINQIPSEFVETIRSSLESNKQSEAYNAWYEEFKESADIVINEMPENVPYNVDTSKYTKTETDDGTEADAGDDTSADVPVDEGTEGTDDGSTDGTEGDASEDGSLTDNETDGLGGQPAETQ